MPLPVFWGYIMSRRDGREREAAGIRMESAFLSQDRESVHARRGERGIGRHFCQFFEESLWEPFHRSFLGQGTSGRQRGELRRGPIAQRCMGATHRVGPYKKRRLPWDAPLSSAMRCTFYSKDSVPVRNSPFSSSKGSVFKSPSRRETTSAPVASPNTLVEVRTMSSARSMPAIRAMASRGI